MEATEYITLPEASDLIRTPIGTLYQWRTKKIGPPSMKVGRRVLYKRSDLDAWLDSITTSSAA
jgi:excisionase family DNA binding protein